MVITPGTYTVIVGESGSMVRGSSSIRKSALGQSVQETVVGLAVKLQLRTPMGLAVFLPARTLALLRIELPREEIKCAANWSELDALAGMPSTTAIVLDPAVGGPDALEVAIKVVRRHSNMPVLAYVAPTASNLKAVFALARNGLADAFCCTEFNRTRCLRATIERAGNNAVAFSFLKLLEARLGQLPSAVASTVRDAFERPDGYDKVSDLARKARVNAWGFSRAIERAGLGTPKKLLAAAKVLRAFSYMQSGSMSVEAISCKLRYSQPRVFHEVITSIFDCSPASLRKYGKPDEVLLHLCEWLYKPGQRRLVRQRRDSLKVRKNSTRRHSEL